jgi:hypothetical protein
MTTFGREGGPLTRSGLFLLEWPLPPDYSMCPVSENTTCLGQRISHFQYQYTSEPSSRVQKALESKNLLNFKERIISRFPGPRLQRYKEDRWLNTGHFESPINDRAFDESFCCMLVGSYCGSLGLHDPEWGDLGKSGAFSQYFCHPNMP